MHFQSTSASRDFRLINRIEGKLSIIFGISSSKNIDFYFLD